jgi:hypothetical protein
MDSLIPTDTYDYKTFGEFCVEIDEDALHQIHRLHCRFNSDYYKIMKCFDLQGVELKPLRWEIKTGFGFDVYSETYKGVTHVQWWTEKIEDHTFTFYYPTSNFVDWETINEYIKKNYPHSKKIRSSDFENILLCRNDIWKHERDLFASLLTKK